MLNMCKTCRMRWHVTALLLCISFACSPARDSEQDSEQGSREEVRREVHTQPAMQSSVVQAEPLAPGAQTFPEGMLALCESYQKVAKSDDPVESQKLLHAWLEEHVTNEKVREVFMLVGEMPPSQRSGMLRAAAAKVGIKSCALAGEGPIIPVAPTEVP